MDAFLRTIAVVVEVLILGGVFYSLLNGVRMIVMDFGIGQEYNSMIKIMLGAVGVVMVVFLISHLAVFYPSA